MLPKLEFDNPRSRGLILSFSSNLDWIIFPWYLKLLLATLVYLSYVTFFQLLHCLLSVCVFCWLFLSHKLRLIKNSPHNSPFIPLWFTVYLSYFMYFMFALTQCDHRCKHVFRWSMEINVFVELNWIVELNKNRWVDRVTRTQPTMTNQTIIWWWNYLWCWLILSHTETFQRCRKSLNLSVMIEYDVRANGMNNIFRDLVS